MNAFQRLQAAQSKQPDQAAAPIEAEYIEKLASACEYAAGEVIGMSIASNKTSLPTHTYTRQPTALEKVAQAAPAPDLMARLLREKLASKQKVAEVQVARNNENIVANILARFTKDIDANLIVRDKQVYEVEPTTVNPVAATNNKSVDAVAALAGTSLSDVLEAAQTANGTSDSAAAGSTKTAGAQGKGPLTVGAATNRLRDRVLGRAAGK